MDPVAEEPSELVVEKVRHPSNALITVDTFEPALPRE